MNKKQKVKREKTGTLKSLIAIALMATATGATATDNPTKEADTGIVSGQVTDTSRNTLPGATIQIESLHTGVTADINGFYRLPNLAPGTYTLKVSYVGYSPVYKKITVL